MNNATNLLARLQEVSCAPVNAIGIQIDLETWGKKPGCAIRSIGASVWDNTTGEQVGPTFYANVCKKSCFDKGLTFDADTVRWWAEQGDDAKAALEVDQVSLTQALSEFRHWYALVCTEYGRGVSVWGNGKEFDVSILEACYAAIHQQAPWPFWASADVRTVVLLGQMLGIDVKAAKSFNGTPHYALDDSLHQGGYTAETMRLIKQVFDKGVECLKSEAEADVQCIDYDTPYYYDGGNERLVGWVVGRHMADGAAAFMEAMDENGDISHKFTLIDIGRTLRPATDEEIAAWKEACAEVTKHMKDGVPHISKAAADVLGERQRQIAEEGRTAEDDDEYSNGELAAAAGSYALHVVSADRRHTPHVFAPAWWPWDEKWFKPTDPRRDLVKAGALILAEVERLDRAAQEKTHD